MRGKVKETKTKSEKCSENVGWFSPFGWLIVWFIGYWVYFFLTFRIILSILILFGQLTENGTDPVVDHAIWPQSVSVADSIPELQQSGNAGIGHNVHFDIINNFIESCVKSFLYIWLFIISKHRPTFSNIVKI